LAQEPDPADLLAEAIYAANDLAVRMYDIHPFIDGNTRATFSLRNFALMRTGSQSIIYIPNEAEFETAWMEARPSDHDWLDALTAEALIAQEERRRG
jgi:fido (protein-threonine AMPylation protein)